VIVLDGGEELKVLARNKLDGPILATPAIVDGKIYVRTEDHLYAFALNWLRKSTNLQTDRKRSSRRSEGQRTTTGHLDRHARFRATSDWPVI
jgi:PQQ-like domain